MIYLFNKIDVLNKNSENDDNSILNKYIGDMDNYLLVSAYNGKGIGEIIAILENVEKIEKEKTLKD